MKKIIAMLLIIAAAIAFGQGAGTRPTQRSETVTSGTTNTFYLGISTAEPTYTPSESNAVWMVYRAITIDDEFIEGRWAYNPEKTGDPAFKKNKWTNRASTNEAVIIYR